MPVSAFAKRSLETARGVSSRSLATAFACRFSNTPVKNNITSSPEGQFGEKQKNWTEPSSRLQRHTGRTSLMPSTGHVDFSINRYKDFYVLASPRARYAQASGRERLGVFSELISVLWEDPHLPIFYRDLSICMYVFRPLICLGSNAQIESTGRLVRVSCVFKTPTIALPGFLSFRLSLHPTRALPVPFFPRTPQHDPLWGEVGGHLSSSASLQASAEVN